MIPVLERRQEDPHKFKDSLLESSQSYIDPVCKKGRKEKEKKRK